MFDPEVEALIQHLALLPHPEGGFYRETYRSSGTIPQASLPAQFSGERSFSTAILFLLPEGAKSSLHRISADEVWHFHKGGPLNVVMLHEDGRLEVVTMGPNVQAGQKLQAVVPGGTWFGAYPAEGSRYSLVGCTVAPGFDFADFEMARRDELLAKHPEAHEMIERLTDLALT